MTGKVDEDTNLVSRAKAGDYSAFEALVSRYERPIYTLARRIVGRIEDAEDVVQETFSSVVEHLPSFREESSFYTWLSRIATNHALKLLRKRRGLATVQLDENALSDGRNLPKPEFIAPWARDPEEAGNDPSLLPLIEEALVELDEKYRLAFVLRDIQGLSTEAAARTLGISEGNLKVRLLRARLQLRERLTRVLGDRAARVAPPTDHEEARHDHEVR
jgi:RNA polymerase sigma-70 factor (ECF subfamily)